MNRRDTLRLFGAALGAVVWESRSEAQGALALTPLIDNLMVLSGAGGNITVLRSPEGLLLLDSGLPDTATAVTGKVKEVASVPVAHLINTHWHYDHTGGNAAFGSSGTYIMAHENCGKRLATTQHIDFFQKDYPAQQAAGQPKETFKDHKQLSFGGQSIQCQYLPPAHTDTDITVHFNEANVYATGDLFFNGFYPFIDYSTGGSIEGMIRNSAAILQAVDNRTKIVPGHGPIGNQSQLQQFHDMLAETNEQISKLVAAGNTADELIAARPTKKYDAQWGNGMLKPQNWVGMLYQGKTREQKKAA